MRALSTDPVNQRRRLTPGSVWKGLTGCEHRWRVAEMDAAPNFEVSNRGNCKLRTVGTGSQLSSTVGLGLAKFTGQTSDWKCHAKPSQGSR